MPPLDLFAPGDTLPPATDILVIGGGIVGVCLALFLAEKGISVTLCEKGVVGGEQSGRNLGWCRSSGHDPLEIPLGKASLDLWRTMDARIDKETGFRETGRLFTCITKADIALQETLAIQARSHDIPVHRLTEDEVQNFLPNVPTRVRAVFHAPQDACADPAKAVPAIATAAHAQGVRIISNCAVRSLEITNGRVTAAITEKGRIACGGAVLAVGAWTEFFCRGLGIHFPMMQVAASVMRTAPVEGGPGFCIGSADHGLTRNSDGSFSISTFGGVVSLGPDTFRYTLQFLPMLRTRFRALHLRLDRVVIREWGGAIIGRGKTDLSYERERGLAPPHRERGLARAQTWAQSLVPMLANVPIRDHWAGVIDAKPNSIPTIDAAPGIDGLWLAGGFSGHGFGFGPGAARLLADMITGDSTIVDAAPYRFARSDRHSNPLKQTMV